jgi:ribosomal protein S18 acetylase RimI-like enzyme
LVAELAGNFVGFLSGWVQQKNAIAETADSNRFGYVSDVWVMPVFRGRRIATQLLQAIEAYLAGFGITRLRIASLAMNASARRCYERAGFSAYEVVHVKVIST